MTKTAVALTVVALAGLSAGCSSDDDGGGEYGARDVCQQFVEKRLKAPSTADFSNEDATETSDGHWTVTGDVDSENSFSANIRNSYVCKVRHTGGGNWSLVDMETTEN